MTQTHTSNRPEGYSKADVDIAGWWLPLEGSIHGKVIGGIKFRNSKRRLTTMYLIRLKEPCICNVKSGNELIPDKVSRGEVVAVFHSGGLHRLANLYGCMVWIAAQLDDDGEWKTKPVPSGDMKLYEILYSGNRRAVPFETRATPGDAESNNGASDDAIDYPDSDSDDDIPF